MVQDADELRTFSWNTSSFIADNKRVWVHCIVHVCHKDDVTIECNRFCKGGHTVKEKEGLPEEKLRAPTSPDIHLDSSKVYTFFIQATSL